MTLQRMMFVSVVLLLCPLVVGLILRRYYRVCWTFLFYCTGVLASNAALAFRPEWNVWDFWLFNELFHAVLKFTVAAEVGWRIFGSLPGARSTLASALLLVSVVTLWAVIGAPADVRPSFLALAAIARVNHGTAWIFGALLAAKLYFRLPVHPLHQAIVRGFVPFLMIFTVGLSLLESYGKNVHFLAGYGYGYAYQLLLVYWNVVAWRKVDDPQVPLEVLQKLQPWR